MGKNRVSRDVIDLRIPRRRLVVLLLVALCCLFASRAYIRSVGGTYRYRLDDFQGKTLTPDNFVFFPSEMARVTEVTYDGDVPIAVIEALAEADGACIVEAGEEGMMFTVKVDPGMVIIADQANFTGWESIAWSICLCFAVACALCVWNVAWLMRRAWYDYQMAAYAGMALFCGTQTVIFLQVLLSGAARSFIDLAMIITTIADRFVWVSLAPTAVLALLVSASNVVLVRHEGRGLTNLLGVAASLAYVVALIAWRFISRQAAESQNVSDYLVALGINSVVSTGIAFGVALLLGVSACAWLAARHVPAMPKEYVLILGCGLRKDGSPTPLLAGRVDAARSFVQVQQDTTGVAATYVPSGGKGSDERWAEAESMRRYLREKGVDEDRILMEDASTNTRENFANAARVIAQTRGTDAPQPQVAFSTTNYHVLRSYGYAHEAGLAAEGIAAPTKLYFWPNAFLREFVGLIAARPVEIALAFVAIAALYGVAEYVVLLG